jgi:hypothetical protein
MDGLDVPPNDAPAGRMSLYSAHQLELSNWLTPWPQGDRFSFFPRAKSKGLVVVRDAQSDSLLAWRLDSVDQSSLECPFGGAAEPSGPRPGCHCGRASAQWDTAGGLPGAHSSAQSSFRMSSRPVVSDARLAFAQTMRARHDTRHDECDMLARFSGGSGLFLRPRRYRWKTWSWCRPWRAVYDANRRFLSARQSARWLLSDDLLSVAGQGYWKWAK